MRAKGKVFLVGAGPGDPDLLTVKACRLLESAEVVVYDRLVSAAILDLVPTGTPRIAVGKAPGQHRFSQEEINDTLARLAGKGYRVVRLKGGDPFVFGRGAEEALHLAAHEIPFEIVPGITAGVACPAYAGIPLTHRGLSRGVEFVTGHCRNGEPLDLDWRRLADPDVTLVIYMGLANLATIRRELLAAGLDAHTPCALIERGTTPHQRRILCDLRTLGAVVAREAVQSPALVVVGRVVELAPALDWFAREAALPDRLDALRVSRVG